MSNYRKILPPQPAVLVVEDEVLIRLAVSDRLRQAGFRVVEAECAEEVLSLTAEDYSIRLIFSDIQMEGPLAGIALARQIRRERPDIEIILTSGVMSLPSDLKDVQFVPKPHDYGLLVALILQALKVSPC